MGCKSLSFRWALFLTAPRPCFHSGRRCFQLRLAGAVGNRTYRDLYVLSRSLTPAPPTKTIGPDVRLSIALIRCGWKGISIAPTGS